MAYVSDRPTAVRGRPAGNPLYTLFAAFPFVCFTLALATDILYWQTSNLMWVTFSTWLLFVGLVGGWLAVAAGVIGYILRGRSRRPRPVVPHALAWLALLVVAFVNNLVHARDGWTAVMPLGLTLSAVSVLLLVVIGWLGRRMAYRSDLT